MKPPPVPPRAAALIVDSSDSFQQLSTISQSTPSPPFAGGPSLFGGQTQQPSANLHRQAQHQRATQSQSRSSSANRGGYGAPSPTASSSGLSPAASTTSNTSHQTSGSSTTTNGGKKLQKLAPKPITPSAGGAVRSAGTGNVQIIRTGHGIEVEVSNQTATASFSGTGGKVSQRAGGSGSSNSMDKTRTNVSGGKGGRFTVDAGGGDGLLGNQMATGVPVRRNNSTQINAQWQNPIHSANASTLSRSTPRI